MDRSSTPSPVLEENSSPVLETVATDKALRLDFEVTATFKLSNIKQYFEDYPTSAARPPELSTPSFGPGPQLRLCISPSRELSTQGIAIFLWLTELKPILRPIFIRFSLTISGDEKGYKKRYFEQSFSHEFSEAGLYGWHQTLTAKIWETEEPLRRANAVYLLVKVVGSLSKTPTSCSPPVLDLLHETIVEAPRSIIRFTVSGCRNSASKKLTNQRVVLADRGVIKNTCSSLCYTGILPDQWNGLLVTDVRSPDCDYDRAVDSEIPESDSDLEDAEDIDEAIAEKLTESCSLSGVGLDGPKRAPSQSSLRLGEDTKHVSGSDVDETSAGQDSQSVELTEIESGERYGPNSEDQMQIDGNDTPATKAQATQTDPPVDPPRLSPDTRTHDVIVVGAAATTWEAFIFYLYTGIIEFAPLLSNGRTERNTYVKNFKEKKRPKPCSPKSMYRIADRAKQEPLKQLALKKIVEELSVDNILPELFSSFTSEYAEVEEEELQFFTQHCDEIMESQAFKNLMVDVATGTYPHAGKLLGKVFQKVKEAK